MTEYIKQNEKAEPLGDGYYIIQSSDGYRFGSDAVALAHFAERYVTRRDRVLDLCSGCGIIGIMLAISSAAHVDCVDIDPQLSDMCRRAIELNGLDNVTAVCGDARDLRTVAASAYDAVVCNPPYYKSNSKRSSAAPAANSEIDITLTGVVTAAARGLKMGGALFMTHVSSRLDEVICACQGGGLTVKKLVVNRNGKTFLLRAVRGGKQYMELEVGEY